MIYVSLEKQFHVLQGYVILNRRLEPNPHEHYFEIVFVEVNQILSLSLA